MSFARRKTIMISTIIVLLLGVISYLLADRYLIRHVEITDVTTYSETYVTSLVSQTGADLTGTTAVDANISGTVSSDEWNYSSDTVTIAIQKYTSDSGNNALTYFVADVTVTDATELSSAFADNQFGTNIIAYTSEIAEANNAIFAVNGDYYGFRTDGIVIRNGIIYRDQPARTGLAFYLDGSMRIYDETQTNAQELLDAGVWNTLSFGPALLESSAIATGFDTVKIDANIGNHPIQGNQPRTGVGIIDKNHFVFIVVDGRSSGYSRGASLAEFAQMFKDLGCTDAYNLDGGGSSTMYFHGRVVNNPLGKNRERGTSDILMIGS
jgi:exopolysaccharide biosynthesis protein